MLDAWINKDDILRILSKSETVDNCIERISFIQSLERLNGTKKPRTKYSIYFAIQNIEKYINDVSKHPNNRYMFKKLKIMIEKYGDRIWYKWHNVMESTLPKKHNFKNYDECMNEMIPKKYFYPLIKLSKRTIARWTREGIIKKHRISVNGLHFEYYIISEILNSLKAIKSGN